MPVAALKKFAEQSGKTLAEAEQAWEEAKEQADKRFHGKIKQDQYWAYVTATTKYKLGLEDDEDDNGVPA